MHLVSVSFPVQVADMALVDSCGGCTNGKHVKEHSMDAVVHTKKVEKREEEIG